jgi:hypothetical protein
MKTKLGQIREQRKVRDRFIYCNQAIRLTTIPKPAINMALAPSIFIEIAPFELEPNPAYRRRFSAHPPTGAPHAP